MTFQNKRVLITGGAGFIGSHLIKRLLEQGVMVRATLHGRGPVIVDKRIEYIRCNLVNGYDCRRVVDGMDYVFLCAGATSNAAMTVTSPMVYVTPNILTNTQILEAAYAAHVEKCLWLGSTVAYPVTNTPAKEEEMFLGEPYEKYFYIGWVNRFAEILCRMYGEKLPRPMTTIVLRPTSVYGPGDDFEFATSHVIPALIRKVVERWDPVEVWGTGEDVRDAIYVDDMVEAMVMAMKKIESYTAINIGLGKGHSVKEILKMILELDEYTNARIIFNASKPTVLPIQLIDTTKAETALGFKAKADLREGLRKTIEWYRESRNIATPRSESRK